MNHHVSTAGPLLTPFYAIAFMERQTQARKPFFAYATLTQPHLPTLPNPAFAGKTGNGEWADMLAEWTTTLEKCWMQ